MRDDHDPGTTEMDLPTGKQKGRKPKYGVRPMSHAERQRDYRHRRATRLVDAFNREAEVSLVTLLDALQQLTRSGKHPPLIHQVLDAIRARFPLPVGGRTATSVARVPPVRDVSKSRTVALRLWVPVENGSKFTRGKKRARADIADMIQGDYAGTVLSERDYRVEMTYIDEADLKKQIDELVSEIWHLADLRNCVADDVSVRNEATGDCWNDHEGGWH